MLTWSRMTLIFKGCVGCGVLAWACVGAGSHALGFPATTAMLGIGFALGAVAGAAWGWAIPSTR